MMYLCHLSFLTFYLLSSSFWYVEGYGSPDLNPKAKSRTCTGQSNVPPEKKMNVFQPVKAMLHPAGKKTSINTDATVTCTRNQGKNLAATKGSSSGLNDDTQLKQIQRKAAAVNPINLISAVMSADDEKRILVANLFKRLKHVVLGKSELATFIGNMIYLIENIRPMTINSMIDSIPTYFKILKKTGEELSSVEKSLEKKQAIFNAEKFEEITAEFNPFAGEEEDDDVNRRLSSKTSSIPVQGRIGDDRKTLADGNRIPVFGLGTYRSTGSEIENVVKLGIDLGYRLIDTAFIYGNEKPIGKAIEEKLAEGNVKREDLFIVTKLWSTKHHPDDVIPAIKRSLSDLRLTYVDLYLIHWPFAMKQVQENEYAVLGNPEIDIPLEDTWRAMEKCVKQGYAKSIGVSNFNSLQIERILKIAEIKPVVNQVEYNPYFAPEKLKNFCKERNIEMMGFSPFSGGKLPNLLQEPILSDLSKKYGKTPAQLILRFLLQSDIIPIPKSSNPERLKQNFEILDFKLTPKDFEKIKSLNKNQRSGVFPQVENFKEYPFGIEF